MRDHRKLRVFQSAHTLVLLTYKGTRSFPDDERYGLRAQLRRGAVSVASNIVEGAARSSLKDYVRFLDISFGAVRELQYQWLLARELEFVDHPQWREVEAEIDATARMLSGLRRSLRKEPEV